MGVALPMGEPPAGHRFARVLHEDSKGLNEPTFQLPLHAEPHSLIDQGHLPESTRFSRHVNFAKNSPPSLRPRSLTSPSCVSKALSDDTAVSGAQWTRAARGYQWGWVPSSQGPHGAPEGTASAAAAGSWEGLSAGLPQEGCVVTFLQGH